MTLKRLVPLALVLALVFAASGCVVISVHPYYNPEQVRFDEDIIGRWGVDDDGENWEFSRHEDTTYLLTITQDTVVGVLEGHLFEAGGALFMDLYPWDFEQAENDDRDDGLWFNTIHLLPTHSVIQIVKKDPDTLALGFLELGWLKEQLKSNPGLVRHEILDDSEGDNQYSSDSILLTASTKELQAFLARVVKNGKAFDIDTVTRMK